MSYFASVNGIQVVGGSLLIPLVGAWTADLHLASPTPISGQVTVTIGNLTLAGTVLRADVYGGQVRARLVAGAGGWRTTIPAQGYGHGTGVKLSTVAQDAASACGEQVNVAVDQTIGNAFVRVGFDESVASDVLWQLVAQGIIPGWHIDQSGVTQLTAWPSSTISTPFTVTDQKPDEGIVVVGTEDYASWMPGCLFTNTLLSTTFTSAGVHYVWDNDGKFRFEVLTGSGGEDRVLRPIRSLVQKELAPLRFFGRYEYTISNPTSTTVDGYPTDTTLGLPDVQNVPLRASSIASVTPTAGALCHIMFLDGRPTEPVCVWCQADASIGPSAVTLAPQSSPVSPVARVDDTVVVAFPPVMPLSGTIGPGPSGPGGLFQGVVVATAPALGIIQSGSPIVGSG